MGRNVQTPRARRGGGGGELWLEAGGTIPSVLQNKTGAVATAPRRNAHYCVKTAPCLDDERIQVLSTSRRATRPKCLGLGLCFVV